MNLVCIIDMKELFKILFYFRCGSFEVFAMKGSSSKQHGGSVHVKFDVLKDAASQIEQSVAGSWQRLQELGVVSIQLDNKQLMCDKSGPCAELSKVESAEFKQYSYAFNGYTESRPVVQLSCYRRSRGGRRGGRGRGSGARGSRQKRYTDPCAYPFASNELCSSAVSAASLAQHQEMICQNSDNTSQRINHFKEDAGLISSEHVLFNMSSSDLPNCLSSDIAFGGVSLDRDSHAVSTKTPSVVNTPHEVVSATTLNTILSHDLPPPSTPFVPKRRKRRKPADGGSETVSAQMPSYMAVTCVDNALLAVHETASYCTNRRFQLNGYYPQQFESPMFCQYTANNAHLMSLSRAGSPGQINLANCVKLPTGSQMVLDPRLSLPTSTTDWSQTTTMELNSIGAESMRRNVQAGSSQLSHTSPGMNVLHPSRGQCEQLHQPAFSEACSPQLLNHFSQGNLDSTHCSPETFDAHAATNAETNIVFCAEHFCRSASSQLEEVSSPAKFCSGSSTSGSALSTQPNDIRTSLSSKVSSLAPLLKPPETESCSAVEMIENVYCSTSATSVCNSCTSVNCTAQSDVVSSNSLPASVSAVVKKHGSDVVNGYHRMLGYTPADMWHTSHKLAQAADVQTVDKSSLLSDDVSNKRDVQPATDCSSITESPPNDEATQVADSSHSENMQSPREFEQCGSSVEVNKTIAG